MNKTLSERFHIQKEKNEICPNIFFQSTYAIVSSNVFLAPCFEREAMVSLRVSKFRIYQNKIPGDK